jgi:hypothetical protein
VEANSTLELVLGVLGGGGLLTAFLAFRKLRPETDSIVVTTIRTAMESQTLLLDQLQELLAERNDELVRCRDEARQWRDRAERAEKRVGEGPAH